MTIKIKLSYLCLSAFLLLLVNHAYTQDLMWAKQIGEIGVDGGREIPYDMAVDALGNVFVTGSFQGTVDFDPGPAIVSLSNSDFHTTDIFIAKYDTHGNYLWAISIGGESHDIGYALAVDQNANVYVIGSFRDTVDFDPGPGTANLFSGSFMAKYDANGNYIWAKNMGCASLDIGLDGNNNIYITGVFSGTVDFDPGSGVAIRTASNRHIFLARYDSNGNYLWAKDMVAKGQSLYPTSNSIAVDAIGNSYITGSFQATVDFDPGPGVADLTVMGKYPGEYDIFIACYDVEGNYKWAKSISGAGVEDFGYGIALDRSGSLYITGQFGGTADFDPGPAVANLISNGDYDAFVAKYDISGNYLWARKLGGNDYNNDRGNAVTTDAAGNVLVTGYFSGTVNFDAGSGLSNLVSNGWEDIFIAKYNDSGSPLWAKSMGGKRDEYGKVLCLDRTGNIYITGTFTDSVDFDFGPGFKYLHNLSPMRITDMFILKIGKCPEQNSLTKVVCDSYSFLDTIYMVSGVYKHNFANINGCDSIVVLTLTIGSTSGNRVITGQYCDSFTFNQTTYHTSGVYTQQYTNAAGCDSNIVLDLTINKVTAAKVIKSGAVLTTQIADSYQWFDCDQHLPIPGATDKVYTATSKGRYAVIVTMGACTDTSDCVTVERPASVDQNLDKHNSIKVYPNPTHKDLFFETMEPLKNAAIRIANSIAM